jgi:hypothetical protein
MTNGLCALSALFVTAVLLTGCSQSSPPNDVAATNKLPTAEAVLGPPPPIIAGRYTIIHSPQVERDTMLLDTATGRTWQLVNNGTDQQEVLAWQPVARYPNSDPN